MMSLLRLTLLFVTLLGMALLTAPDTSSATPAYILPPMYGAAYIKECQRTSDACFFFRELCRECVRGCSEAAAHSALGKHGNFLAEECRTRGGAGIFRSDAR